MKPLFTIHGGEYLFGNAVEARFPGLKIWIPSKDNGVDFLLTNSDNSRALSIQVKYSRDFNWSHGNQILRPHTKSAAWYSLNPAKIEGSKADYWVMVNYDGFKKSTDFLFFRPSQLISLFNSMGRGGNRMESYILVSNSNKAYETRNLKKAGMQDLVLGKLDGTSRDITSHLNRWDIIEQHFKN